MNNINNKFNNNKKEYEKTIKNSNININRFIPKLKNKKSIDNSIKNSQNILIIKHFLKMLTYLRS